MKIGDEFYYKGDMANQECKLTVRAINSRIITLTDEAGTEKRVEDFALVAPRFQPFQEWKANREQQIADMYARYTPMAS